MARSALHWAHWRALIIAPVLATLPVAASPAAPAASTTAAKSPPPAATTLRLASSATASAFARNILVPLKQGHALEINLSTTGSETALEDVRAGRADAALVSRKLTAAEEVEFRTLPLALDSLLLIVNERNPLERADAALIRGIFSRQIADWRQVGAGNSGAIVPVTRRPTYGTRTLFDNTFGVGRIIPTGIVELASNLATVLYVGADPQAIGYVSAAAFDDALQHGLRIKALKLNGLSPSAAGCRQTDYPLCRPISLIRKQGKAARGHERLESFLLSDEGQTLLEQNGFAPMKKP
ncbi:MAG: phosphate transport system substrate-binding protein [Pseudomonadota bacterium]|nr:phosphate transport system substrate-binding protein [Pseudomonadota bacterium]